MNNITVLSPGKPSHSRISRNSKLFKTIVQAIQEKKGEAIVSLDLKKIHEAVSDFFIICEANNSIQLRAIADFVEEKVKKRCAEIPYRHEGWKGEQWIIIDYINVVVHVMMPQPRKFYNLEEMWSDASVMEHQ